MAKKSIHLAIIPDGNRRWAKRRNLLPWEGHRRALMRSRALVEWCRDNSDISVLTLWGFSTENWNRSAKEVKHLMKIYEEWLTQERSEFNKHQTRFVHSGRLDRIPESLRQLIVDIENETNDYTGFTLNFALDYGGRDEIVRAVQAIGNCEQATEEKIRQHFDHPELPDIDLVIRTSGEHRTSGFFIWQAAYAEWLFEKKFFPQLKPADLEAALKEYHQRQRRFGK